jgi:hypothetical protein
MQMIKPIVLTAALALGVSTGSAVAVETGGSGAGPAPNTTFNQLPGVIAKPAFPTPRRYTTGNDDVRMSKLIGTDVYNDRGQKLGRIDDVLMGQDSQLGAVVNSGGKQVEVPLSRMQFGNARQHNETVILPGTTKSALMSEQPFRYTQSGNG